MLTLKTISCLALACSTFGCASMHAAPPPVAQTAQAQKSSEPRHVYRLDFVVASSDPSNQAGLPGGGSYTMNLEEGRSGEIRSGSNIPLSSGARIDVGTKLWAECTALGDDLLIDNRTEISAGDSGSIHKLSAAGEALVTSGKPALIASAEDPQGHSRYQVTVTATKLR
ncbi:MAG: hypothetical protein ACRELY_27650 [Polyangiaceae bacterium]